LIYLNKVNRYKSSMDGGVKVKLYADGLCPLGWDWRGSTNGRKTIQEALYGKQTNKQGIMMREEDTDALYNTYPESVLCASMAVSVAAEEID
jgi:hypothetical protein